MVRTLYLMRHAEAAPKEARQEDKARELTPAGVKTARHVAASLVEDKVEFDLLVTSSAIRAEQTIQLVAEGLGLENPSIVVEDALYEASVRQLLDYVNKLEDNFHHVLIVGHNPAMSYLAEYLTKSDIGDMSPGSIAIIRFDLASWKLVSENLGVLQRHVVG